MAASISITSTALPARISVQESHTPQGSATGLLSAARAAVQRHCQDAGDCRLADSAMAAEDIAVRDALLRDRILQGAGDMFLADDVGEFLRPVFARQDLVAHRNH